MTGALVVLFYAIIALIGAIGAFVFIQAARGQ
jgi:hypothetical protein